MKGSEDIHKARRQSLGAATFSVTLEGSVSGFVGGWEHRMGEEEFVEGSIAATNRDPLKEISFLPQVREYQN